ncbi:hypothetical protein, partial [Gordonia sp. (in: high G+C Gram-positive bacteria)]|uniref:hypothetical protein n=1 Tax=Gordonia sp. (in: high G+C Gram-positive bacteria) TaxID=84139 RepID=UPI003C719913
MLQHAGAAPPVAPVRFGLKLSDPGASFIANTAIGTVPRIVKHELIATATDYRARPQRLRFATRVVEPTPTCVRSVVTSQPRKPLSADLDPDGIVR